jgi:hypothetical protein
MIPATLIRPEPPLPHFQPEQIKVRVSEISARTGLRFEHAKKKVLRRLARILAPEDRQ